MKILYILMLSGLLPVNLIQIQREKSGDIWRNQTCDNGTYVIRQGGSVDCIHQMKQAGTGTFTL